MKIPGRAQRLTKWVGAAALLLLPLLTVWNLIALNSKPSLFVRIGQTLSGVTQQRPLEFSLAAIKDGRLQKAMASRIAEAMPIRPFLVRLNNQLEFSIFRKLNTPGILLGSKDELLEKGYREDYCGRQDNSAASFAQQAIPALRDIQAFYKSRGAAFLYVITPSKAAHLPEYFVELGPCPSSTAARTKLIPDYAESLRRAGIALFDAATFIHGLKGQYPIELFPQGGTHWNAIGSARATLEMIKAIDQQTGEETIPSFTFDRSIARTPEGSDRDLADLINVLLPPISYATEKITLKPISPCADRSSRLIDAAVVGGSFMHAPTEFLISAGCLPQLNLYFYLRLGRFGGVPYHLLRPELGAADYDHLREVKVLILEENEAVVGRSGYVDALHKILLGQ